MSSVEWHSTSLSVGSEPVVRVSEALDGDKIRATENGIVVKSSVLLDDAEDVITGGKTAKRGFQGAGLRLIDKAEAVASDVAERFTEADGYSYAADSADDMAEQSFSKARTSAASSVGREAKRARGFSQRIKESRNFGRSARTAKKAAKAAGKTRKYSARAAKNGAKVASKVAGTTAKETGKVAVKTTTRVGRFATKILSLFIPKVGLVAVLAAGVLVIAGSFLLAAAETQERELSETELSVVAYLYSKDYSIEATAAILGNLEEDGWFSGGLFKKAPRPGDFTVDDSKWTVGREAVFSGYAFAKEDQFESTEAFKSCEDIKLATWSWMFAYSNPLVRSQDEYVRRLRTAREYYHALTSGQYSQTLTILSCAYSQLGVAYIWGWARPYVGLDCSGLTQWCYKQAGITIPKYSEAQMRFLSRFDVEEALPGDILWKPGHVVIYLGDDRYIHAMDEDHGVLFGEGKQKFSYALRYVG